MAISRRHIIWAYRLLLGREPESRAMVDAYRESMGTREEVLWSMLLSDEFGHRNPEFACTATPADGLPLPPGELIHLVAGNSSVLWFLRKGAMARQAVLNMLAKNRTDPGRFARVLDFGCGCGRVLRHWHESTARFHGTDYNPKLVEWCRENLGFAQLQVNGLEPPLDYPDAHFDFVYALSVFTHFPGALQLAWLEEMQRILRPGGMLYISVHGRYYTRLLGAEERRRFDRGELVVHSQELAGSNVCNAFHPRRYLETVFDPVLELVDIWPQGATGNPRQDAVLLRRR